MKDFEGEIKKRIKALTEKIQQETALSKKAQEQLDNVYKDIFLNKGIVQELQTLLTLPDNETAQKEGEEKK